MFRSSFFKNGEQISTLESSIIFAEVPVGGNRGQKGLYICVSCKKISRNLMKQESQARLLPIDTMVLLLAFLSVCLKTMTPWRQAAELPIINFCVSSGTDFFIDKPLCHPL